jgi:hypothetical protein
MTIARVRKIVAAACIGLWAVLGPVRPLPAGDAERSLEYPVKAAFLVNFAKFAVWPADSVQARAPAVSICVLGRDPFGEILEKTVAGRSVGGRPIAIQRQEDVQELRACHVLFIATSEPARLAQTLETLSGQPVITVGESDGFARQGGIIGLVVEDNRARFEVNLQTARREGLVLSSKLLGVARMVAVPPAGER